MNPLRSVDKKNKKLQNWDAHFLFIVHPSQSSEAFLEKQNCFCLELLKDDKDKDKKRAVTQAAFKRKFKKNSDFWVYEKKVRLIVRKVRKYFSTA
jgi:hypothetical protein